MSNAAAKVQQFKFETARRYESLIVAPKIDLFFGATVELNPLGTQDRICSYNCPYCDLKKSHLTMSDIRKSLEHANVDELIAGLRETLTHWKPTWPKLDAISISGNGEPTLHPNIDILVSKIKSLRNELRPGLPIVLYSNGAQLAAGKVFRAIQEVDEKVLKIDAGNDSDIKTINAPLIRISLGKIINAIRKLDQATIQSMFVAGPHSNMHEKSIDDWIEVLGMIAPKKVFLHTVIFKPQSPMIEPATEDDLHMISQKLERRTGIRATVFFK